MTKKAKKAVLRSFGCHAVPSDYAERPWWYMAPIKSLSAAFRAEPATNAGILADEVERMWDIYCRKQRPSNVCEHSTPPSKIVRQAIATGKDLAENGGLS